MDERVASWLCARLHAALHNDAFAWRCTLVCECVDFARWKGAELHTHRERRKQATACSPLLKKERADLAIEVVHGRCSPAYGMADGSSVSASVLLLS